MPTPLRAISPPPELVAYLDSLSEPHILFDGRYRIAAANAAYRHRYGDAHPVVGRHCYEVSHHFDRPCDESGESCPLNQARLTGQRERVLHLHHTPQGEAYVHIELVPLRNEAGALHWFIERMVEMDVAHGAPVTEGMVGRAPAFKAMLELVARVGPSMAAVLLEGESGTGKELAARAVHAGSMRSRKPLVVVECAALTETLFESELFGHERGAFTGATSSKPGLLEAAQGGTLFLDEVGDIPLPMQVKLLRLLETGMYRRVGSTALRHADIRVVSATHRDLPGMVAAGQFREDLYHRLNVFPIRLPALRDRLDDLPSLATALLNRVAPERHLRISPGAMSALRAHAFPGNVRELRNVMERLSLLCDGDVVEAGHVQRALHGRLGLETGAPPPEAAPTHAPTPPGAGTLDDLAREALLARLSSHQGTRAELAAALGISPRSLYRRLKALGMG